MKQLVFILAIGVFVLSLAAQTNEPVRLAVVADSAEVEPAADVLTAQLSRSANLQLLERDQVTKVYQEQVLSAGNANYLKLGELLGADGLLLMETVKENANEYLNIRLVAVKPGVVLVAERFNWPPPGLTAWAGDFARHLELFLPKLAVREKAAVPISVVNLRSALQTDEARETERQIKLLAIQRLSREPQLFVLERQQMNLLAEEKDMKLDDSPFWNGRYLLDGVLDQDSYDAATLTLNARLIPPQGGTPIRFQVSGSRTNLAEIINQLGVKVDAALKINLAVAPWNATDEARDYLAEARWAMRWRIYDEAQTAIESAWALGRRDPEAARLRIQAYSQNVPPEDFSSSKMEVQVIPNADEIKLLLTAMKYFNQDAPLLLDDPNAPVRESFATGLQLLRQAAALLESYYYTAELRADKEDELSGLRQEMRGLFATWDARESLLPDPLWQGRNLMVNYRDLKWEEGGMAYEEPTAALLACRSMIEEGYHPEHLPRVVGWTWEIRKTVPHLLRQFVNDLCADTNPAVNLEGCYLALLAAPRDEQGSLEKRETILLSAMWANRQWLYHDSSMYRDSGSISLVTRTENELRARYRRLDGRKFLGDFYDREPFASFKQRLRLDFLATVPGTNISIFSGLFPNTSVQMASPAQARELLPWLINCQQRYPTRSLAWTIASLRGVAGLSETNESGDTTPAAAPEPVLEARYIPWNLGPGSDPQRGRHFHDLKLRNGRLWVRVSNQREIPAYINSGVSPESYVAVDILTGAAEETILPAALCGGPGEYEVGDNALFINMQGQLYRHPFQSAAWEEIAAPLEGGSQLVWLNKQLFISRSDGLLSLDPDSKAIRVVVSSRRQPALNEADSCWTVRTQIYPQADGKLGALSDDHGFSFDPLTGKWLVKPALSAGVSNHFNFKFNYISADGALQLLTGATSRRYLTGYWNDGQTAEALLMEPGNHGLKDRPGEQELQKVRWDWPQLFPLEPSSILAGDKSLWVLCPRKYWQHWGGAALEPVQFGDARQATLFYFGSEFRQPCSVAIHFENNGHAEEPFDPQLNETLPNQDRLFRNMSNLPFWLKTPAGLVFGAPAWSGHWLIANADLQTALASQSQIFLRQIQTTATAATRPSTP